MVRLFGMLCLAASAAAAVCGAIAIAGIALAFGAMAFARPDWRSLDHTPRSIFETRRAGLA